MIITFICKLPVFIVQSANTTNRELYRYSPLYILQAYNTNCLNQLCNVCNNMNIF